MTSDFSSLITSPAIFREESWWTSATLVFFLPRFDALGSFTVILQDDQNQIIMMVGKIGVPLVVAIALFPSRSVPLSRRLGAARQSIKSALLIWLNVCGLSYKNNMLEPASDGGTPGWTWRDRFTCPAWYTNHTVWLLVSCYRSH